MAAFDRFYKREKLVSRTIEVEESLYKELEKLSKNVYEASVNKLVNASIEHLLKKEQIDFYVAKDTKYIARSFLIKKSFLDELYNLKSKYRISMYHLINIAIRSALIDEGILKDKSKKGWY